MSRRITSVLALALLIAASHQLLAQRIPDLNAPKRAAERAANATNKHISDETGQDRKTVGKQPAPQAGKASGPAPTAKPLSGQNSVALIPSGTSALPQVTREIFTYEPEGRRDPFYSLILTEDLRPLLSDLKLVAILYAPVGGRSVAIMRDLQTNAQYRVNTGMTLGRMHVAQIKPRAVIFTLDEFGLNRQDSLFLADTSKTRIR